MASQNAWTILADCIGSIVGVGIGVTVGGGGGNKLPQALRTCAKIKTDRVKKMALMLMGLPSSVNVVPGVMNFLLPPF